MLDAAQVSGDDDLVAQARLLRAAALLELGDPAGRDELLSYITLAGNLGHARGRWGALTRQATFAQLAGRAEESARFGEQALELGLAIGEPDAAGCFFTSRLSLVALGVREPAIRHGRHRPAVADVPGVEAWPFAVRGEARAAAAALGDFSVLDIIDVDGPGGPGRGRRRLRGGRFGRPAVVGVRAAPSVRRQRTSSWSAARPTTPPSTITSALSRPRSATPPAPKDTSEPRWRCTNDSARPAGRACRSRRWPGSLLRPPVTPPTSCGR